MLKEINNKYRFICEIRRKILSARLSPTPVTGRGKSEVCVFSLGVVRRGGGGGGGGGKIGVCRGGDWSGGCRLKISTWLVPNKDMG